MTLMKEMDLTPPEGEENIQAHPFLLLGYGVNAYFDILNSLIWCFSCVTIFSIPIYILYANEVGFSDQGKSYLVSKFSLGNMGGSSISCA